MTKFAGSFEGVLVLSMQLKLVMGRYTKNWTNSAAFWNTDTDVGKLNTENTDSQFGIYPQQLVNFRKW